SERRCDERPAIVVVGQVDHLSRCAALRGREIDAEIVAAAVRREGPPSLVKELGPYALICSLNAAFQHLPISASRCLWAAHSASDMMPQGNGPLLSGFRPPSCSASQAR